MASPSTLTAYGALLAIQLANVGLQAWIARRRSGGRAGGRAPGRRRGPAPGSVDPGSRGAPPS